MGELPTTRRPPAIVEHEPWVGQQFHGKGIKGQQIAVVGFSHYLAHGAEDHKNLTKCTIQRVIKRESQSFLSFFYSVESYFDYAEDLWRKILFFNFIPNAIGEVDRRYAYGTPDQVEHGHRRVTRLLQMHLPNKIIVLTRKGWSEFPPTCEEVANDSCPPLDETLFPSFTQGTYRFGQEIVRAFGLRHPLYADLAEMKAAVSHILALPIGTN